MEPFAGRSLKAGSLTSPVDFVPKVSLRERQMHPKQDAKKCILKEMLISYIRCRHPK